MLILYSFEMNKPVPSATFILLPGYEYFSDISPFFELVPQILLVDAVRKTREVEG